MLGISGRMATKFLLASCRVADPCRDVGADCWDYCYQQRTDPATGSGEWHHLAMTSEPPDGTIALDRVAAEIEQFVSGAGWDRPPTLFALVPTRLLLADPAAAAVLGSSDQEAAPDQLTPIAQQELPDGPLDQALARIGWPAEVAGCALSQEIVMLPPSAEPELTDLGPDAAANWTAGHPERREARLVVVVLRDGTAESTDDLLTGTDLAPNLTGALLATFAD
jgi:hypothetical protein